VDRQVLVINKLGTLRRITVQALESLGYSHIIEVSELDEAIDRLETLNDVMIILELSLTEWKNVELEFVRYLRKYQKLKNIAIIITTQTVESDLIGELCGLGIKELVVRPFEVERYSSKLKAAMQRIENNPRFWTTLIGS
jgi:CheY-like chemotaxis protein